jgi:hypothetical protein
MMSSTLLQSYRVRLRQIYFRSVRFNVALILAGASFSLYSLLCSVFSTTFTENGGKVIALPREHMARDVRDNVDLGALVEESNEIGRKYIFVVDCSDSIRGASIGGGDWYRTATTLLEDHSFKFGVSDTPTGGDIEKAALFSMLYRMWADAGRPDSKGDYTRAASDEFSIWRVCGEGEAIYPRSGDWSPISREAIVNAIDAIEDPTRGLFGSESSASRGETNFADLFRKIRTTFELTSDKRPLRFDRIQYIVSIISDMKHDAGLADSTPRENLNDQWEVVRQEIKLLANEKIAVNLLSLSKDAGGDFAKEERLISFFRQNMEWYRLNTSLTLDGILDPKEKSLYPARFSDRYLCFYYEDPISVDSDLVIRVPAKEKIVLSIPVEHDHRSVGNFGLAFGFGAKGQRFTDVELKGRVFSGSQTEQGEIDEGGIIALRYRGALPDDLSTIKLGLSLGSQGLTYMAPVRFVRRLPRWAAWLFVLLQSILVICVIYCISHLGFDFWKYAKSHGQKRHRRKGIGLL